LKLSLSRADPSEIGRKYKLSRLILLLSLLLRHSQPGDKPDQDLANELLLRVSIELSISKSRCGDIYFGSRRLYTRVLSLIVYRPEKNKRAREPRRRRSSEDKGGKLGTPLPAADEAPGDIFVFPNWLDKASRDSAYTPPGLFSPPKEKEGKERPP